MTQLPTTLVTAPLPQPEIRLALGVSERLCATQGYDATRALFGEYLHARGAGWADALAAVHEQVVPFAQLYAETLLAHVGDELQGWYEHPTLPGTYLRGRQHWYMVAAPFSEDGAVVTLSLLRVDEAGEGDTSMRLRRRSWLRRACRFPWLWRLHYRHTPPVLPWAARLRLSWHLACLILRRDG
jgi:hypothetical protein